MDLDLEIQQVGKRWFLVIAPDIRGRKWEIDVEATYSNRTEWRRENDYKPVYFREWVMTGKGSKKYREKITIALDGFVDASERPNTLSAAEAETGLEGR